MTNIKPTVTKLVVASLFLLSSAKAQQITWSKIEPPKAFMDYWDISPEQMQQYETYMQFDGKYQHSHLNPLYVLSIISQSPEEKGYFAAKAAKHEHNMSKQEIETSWLISNEMEKQGLVDLMQQFTDKLTGIDTFSYLPEKINKDWQSGDQLVMAIDDSCVPRTCVGQLLRMTSTIGEGKGVSSVLLNKRKKPMPKEVLSLLQQNPKVHVRNYDPIEHHAVDTAINQLAHLRKGKLIRKF